MDHLLTKRVRLRVRTEHSTLLRVHRHGTARASVAQGQNQVAADRKATLPPWRRDARMCCMRHLRPRAQCSLPRRFFHRESHARIFELAPGASACANRIPCREPACSSRATWRFRRFIGSGFAGHAAIQRPEGDATLRLVSRGKCDRPHTLAGRQTRRDDGRHGKGSGEPPSQ